MVPKLCSAETYQKQLKITSVFYLETPRHQLHAFFSTTKTLQPRNNTCGKPATAPVQKHTLEINLRLP